MLYVVESLLVIAALALRHIVIKTLMLMRKEEGPVDISRHEKNYHSLGGNSQ